MIFLRSPQEAHGPTAVALGSFDGLHHGHRRVIAAVAAAPSPLVPTVVSFWPHPREVLKGEPRLRLDLPAEKLELLEPLGIRQLVLVPFDRQLAALSPQEFVDQVLIDQLQARRVAVGADFCFGAGRAGNADLLCRLGDAQGLQVQVLPMLADQGGRFSSSRIRRALAAGRLDEARDLLERPYRFRGVVHSGRGLGRQLGWPTANLQIDGRKFLPREGVYAAWAWTPDGLPMAAVMNLGPQPTVDPEAPSAVEVHLLDRSLELNGLELVVQPVRWLRSQQAFASLEALTTQIGVDADLARAVLTNGSEAWIGVAQAPDDEQADAAEQQHP
ncbi:MAG: bifunctional riboflavin kinase/FAD synthetase [Cyanobacteriota bacterium]